MKRIISFFITIICAPLFALPAGALEYDEIISEAAVLMDAKTGQVLFDKNMDKMMYPASTTKIMTGLLAAERCRMDDTATVSESAVKFDVWGSSNIALTPDEELPVDSLMYALMLPSANDAANTLAEHIAGSQPDFAQFMTERARAIGAMSTRFANAHGLHDPNHYTTAHDLALITREATQNPLFMTYFSADKHTIPATNKQPLERPFENYHLMLIKTSRYYNPDVLAGKVGYTQEAGHTLSTVARRDGRTLICVVLNSPYRYDKFKDTEKLLSFGFDEFTEITVPKERFAGFTAEILNGSEQTGTVDFFSGGDFTALLHNDIDADSIEITYSHNRPFEAGETVAAYAEFTARGDDPAIPENLGKMKLESKISMFEQAAETALSFNNVYTEDDGDATRWWLTPLTAALAVLACFSGLFALHRYNVYSRRRRRRRRLERRLQSQEY